MLLLIKQLPQQKASAKKQLLPYAKQKTAIAAKSAMPYKLSLQQDKLPGFGFAKRFLLSTLYTCILSERLGDG
ncbi:MAG: hypothetical protein ACO1PI_07685 [Bacteroidota bacterium]